MRSLSSVSARRISPCAGQEDQQRAAVRAQRARTASATWSSIRCARIAPEIARLDREGAALGSRPPAHRRAARRRARRRASPTSPARADPSRSPLRIAARGPGRDRRRASARGTRRRARRRRRRAPGSSRIMRVKTPSVTTSMRVAGRHLRVRAAREAHGLADLLAQRRGHARGGGAGGQAARLQHEHACRPSPRARPAAPAARAWSCRRPAARPARRQLVRQRGRQARQGLVDRQVKYRSCA